MTGQLDRRCFPRLAGHARVRFDRHSGQQLLLSPERGLLLNDSAAAIVAACDGRRELQRIKAEFACGQADAARVMRDVEALIAALCARGLLELVEEPR